VCASILPAACGGTGSATPRGQTAAQHGRASLARPHVSFAIAGRLSRAVSGEALIARSGSVLVLGGLNELDESTSAIQQFTPPSARAQAAGTLAEAKHDLAAGVLGSRSVVLGGGSLTELDSVEEVTPNNSGVTVGSLPGARSDLAAVTVGTYLYVVGGYDGSTPVAEVLRTRDGRRYQPFGALPVAVRYPAVAAVGSTIYVFGGELEDGADSDAVQAVDTTTGHSRLVARLPLAVSHASAVAFGASVLLIGGRARGTALRRVLEYLPASGRLRPVASLPLAVSNAAAVRSGAAAYLVGGIGAEGQTLASIVAVRE
jgi:N-acetylneuraminic acid mutarotase